MTTNNIKPPVIPTRRPSFNGGLEPGSLRGSRIEIAPQEGPDDSIRNLTQAMNGPQLRAWLKQGNNRQEYDAYLERKKERHE
jgi:hypothetical protein